MDSKSVAVCSIILMFGVFWTDGRNFYAHSRFSQHARQENSLSPFFNDGNGKTGMKKDIRVHHDLGGTTVVVTGSRLELQCDSVGGPMPGIEWYRGRVPVTQGLEEDNEIRGFGISKVVARYIVDCATLEHEGEYTCKAQAGGKETTTKPTLVVVEGADSDMLNTGVCPQEIAPRFTMFTTMTLQNIGNNVRVPCRAHGLPRPRVFWTRDGKLVDHPRFKFHEDGDMEIHSLQWDDMGTYTCVAENTLGKESTSTFLYPMRT